MHEAILILEGGKTFSGKPLGYHGITIGEVCFTTGMTGYQHTITDPSFANQIITFTFPHIGNIGINQYDNEREKVFANGIILREFPIGSPSHPSSIISLHEWLLANKIVGICDVDTRAITRYIRDQGAVNGIICSGPHIDIEKAKQELSLCPKMAGQELALKIAKQKGNINHCNRKSNKKVVIVDFGMKAGIAQQVSHMDVIIVSASENLAEEVLSYQPDGIILSNGPGDPEATAQYSSPEIIKLLDTNIPLFAICLGHQLLAISLGCRTVKMKTGHRGANHPVYNLETKKVEISSQNHGFVIDENTIPDNVEVTHISLFDKTIEGIRLKNKPVFSVQYHPESCPGPNDSHYLFERFIDEIMHQ